MMEFDRHSRVIFELDGKKYRGRVTRVMHRKRGIVTDSGKRLQVGVGRLRYSPDRVLILETRLDPRTLRSNRTYGPMMQQWLSAYDVVALYERVHTVESLRRFIRREGKNVATRFIQIIGHGTHMPGRVTATFNMTFGKLDLVKQADVFEGLDGKILIFSCCEVGGNIRAMEAIKEASGAAAIIGYRRWIYDWHSNICEVLLYDRLITSRMSPRKVVNAVNDALEDLGIKVGPEGSKKPVLLCH
jgi:hypothetical protein